MLTAPRRNTPPTRSDWAAARLISLQPAPPALPGLQPARHSFEERPLLVFWETTVACPLSCRHCRASALQHPLPGQLSTAQAHRLMEQVVEMGPPRPVLVLTGGDCLSRPDLLELTGYARELGLRVALSPSVSSHLDRKHMEHFRELGVRAVSISLDGALAATHDAVRGTPGHFQLTVRSLRWLIEMGFRVQVNTTVMGTNLEELADIAALLVDLRVPIWEVFFLIQVGRGGTVGAPSAAANEDVCHFLYDVSAHPLLVRTVEAPFFRRVVAQRRSAGEESDPKAQYRLGPLYQRLHARLDGRLGVGERDPRPQTVGTRDGQGVIFVAHDGTVRPSGFLPVAVGNVLEQDLGEVYRTSPLLRRIRSGDFSGRCGVCPYQKLCGGSRARAFAATGDPLGEDPGCQFRPPLGS